MVIRALLSRLFGGSTSSAPSQTNLSADGRTKSRQERDTTYSDPMLMVTSRRFMGLGWRSPNKRWVVGVRDRLAGSNPRPGHADGSAVLVDYQSDVVAFHVDGLKRPMEAVVSDAGICVINDANFGECLSGDVQVFDANGKRLFRRQYQANVYNLAISTCGRFVAAQTCNASHEDGNRLEVFDTSEGSILFSVAPETGWADKYDFALNEDGAFRHLTVIHRELGRFHYSPAGVLMDREAFRKARLKEGGAEGRIYNAKEELKTANGDKLRVQEVLNAVSTALADLAQNRTDYRAIGLRVQGEALEQLGRIPEAVTAYEAALALNPKIGIAKRCATLKRS